MILTARSELFWIGKLSRKYLVKRATSNYLTGSNVFAWKTYDISRLAGCMLSYRFIGLLRLKTDERV